MLFNSESKIFRYGDETDILKEFFKLRLDLYSLRKDYMLTSLQKEIEILVNKVKFIQAIIDESLKINRVKRKILIKALVNFGLKPKSVIDTIMQKFALIGQQAHNKPIKAVIEQDGNNDGDEERKDPAMEEDEALAEGEVSAKEFDYLLSMPMWSLTEEKVEQLIKLMNEKKMQYDILKKKAPTDLWTDDLDAFKVELDKVWEQEEKDRLKNGGVKNEGKKGKRKAANNPPARKKNQPEQEPENKPKPKPKSKKGKNPKSAAESQASTPKKKNTDDMTLRERMMANFSKDMKMPTSLFSGKQGLNAAQHEAKKLGGGIKRRADETTIFKELNSLANLGDQEDDSVEEFKMPQRIDLTQRR